jgi:hypothetical protein
MNKTTEHAIKMYWKCDFDAASGKSGSGPVKISSSPSTESDSLSSEFDDSVPPDPSAICRHGPSRPQPGRGPARTVAAVAVQITSRRGPATVTLSCRSHRGTAQPVRLTPLARPGPALQAAQPGWPGGSGGGCHGESARTVPGGPPGPPPTAWASRRTRHKAPDPGPGERRCHESLFRARFQQVNRSAPPPHPLPSPPHRPPSHRRLHRRAGTGAAVARRGALLADLSESTSQAPSRPLRVDLSESSWSWASESVRVRRARPRLARDRLGGRPAPQGGRCGRIAPPPAAPGPADRGLGWPGLGSDGPAKRRAAGLLGLPAKALPGTASPVSRRLSTDAPGTGRPQLARAPPGRGTMRALDP